MAMKAENVLQEKSYKFAIRIVRLYQHLSSKKKEYVLSKQVLKSGKALALMSKKRLAVFPELTFMQNSASPIKKRARHASGFAFLRTQAF